MRLYDLCAISLLMLTLFTGCENNTSTGTDDAEQVVVRAYLFANEAVKDIEITMTLSLSTDDTLAPPVNDATVFLMKSGVRYDLVPTSGDSGYYHYPENDLPVQTGDVFEIGVDYFDNLATGETTVPGMPRNLTISDTMLYVPDLDDIDDMMDFDFDSLRNQVTMNWDEEPDGLFYVAIENLEINPDSIEIFGEKMAGDGPSFFSTPTNDNEYNISFMNISCYGRHLVKVYQVNQEYVDLYVSRQQDSRDLNEPLTNIENGLGIFSAFNCDSLYFTAVEEGVR